MFTRFSGVVGPSSNSARFAVLAGVLAAVVLIALPASAGAWTASVSGQSLAITGAADTPNKLTLEDDGVGGLRVVEESGRPYTGSAPAGCTTPLPAVLTCASGTAITVSLVTGPFADTITNASSLGGVLLDGGQGNDTLYAGAHGDRLQGADGDDQFFGGAGDDALTGGDGADQIYGGPGTDVLTGGAGDDRLFGGSGNDSISGEDGVDLLSGTDGNDTLNGGGGRDTLIGGDGDDSMLGGAGADILTGENGNDAVDGGEDDDQASGDAGNDLVVGGSGSDELDGGTGNDRLDAGDGADRLNGGTGADTVLGGWGNDDLLGGADNDVLDGGADNDQLDGGEGADSLAGGDGTDKATYAPRTEPVTVTLDGVANDGASGEADDVAVDIEAVDGGSGADVLVASASGTALTGGAGSDVLIGQAGPDDLRGGAGDDTLRGGQGADTIAGDDGVDTVTYSERTAAVNVTLGSDRPAWGEAGEGDTITGIESVTGGAGADTLVTELGSPAVLDGGAGSDVLRADDSAASDTLRCGAGTDSAEADRTDQVSGDCERVLRDGRQVKPSVPRIFLGNRVATVGSDGTAVLLLTCSAQTSGSCTGTARAAFSVAGRRGAAYSSVRLVPRARGRVRLRLSSTSLRLFKRAKHSVKATVEIKIKDGSGVKASRTVTVTLRAGRSVR